MKRRAGRQTSGEKQPPPRSRGVLAVSVWLLVLGVAFVLNVVLPFVGGSLLKVIVPWREIEQPLSVLLGLGFVLGAAGGLVRIATGNSVPGTTGRQKVYAGIVLVALGLGGAGFLAFGLAPRSGAGF
jgi:hypothetical protein